METPFLFHLLRSLTSVFRSGGQTGTQANLNTDIVNRTLIPIPPPYEQRAIADILDTVDATIQHTEALITKLQNIKAGLLHDLLSYGLDEHGNLRDPKAHPEQFKESPLGLIPKEWKVCNLLDLLTLPSGQVDPKQFPYKDWILVAPDHIERATGRLLKTETAAQQNAISGKYVFEKGDVVYSKIRPYLRKVIVAEFQGLCSADMYPFRPAQEIDSYFLLYLLLGERFSRFAEAVSMRSGFPKINREEIGEYQTPIPRYDEQLKIASMIRSHERRLLSEQNYLAKLRDLKTGLMDDLLTGRVRVCEVDVETLISG